MRATVEGTRLVVHDVPRHSPTFSSMPSARWDKRRAVWTYYSSPLAARRIARAADSLEEDLISNGQFSDMVSDFSNILESRVWKSQRGTNAVGEMLLQFNPFDTTTMPWNHQVCAHSFIHGKAGALLAMEMGTGKTLVAIQRILDLKPKRTLVVAPLAVCEVWPDEWETHVGESEHQVAVLDAAGSAKRGVQLDHAETMATARGLPLIVVVNYESFWRPSIAKRILASDFDLVIYDEAHKLKTPSGKASKFAARLAWMIQNRLGLTGTPLPNNPLDAFGLWRAIDPSLFGTVFAKFRKQYARMGGFEGRQVVGWINQDKFKRLMDLLTYRVDIDVLDLPEATDTVRYLELPADAKETYHQLHKTFVADVAGGMVTASNALARLMKLREVTCGFVIDDDGMTQYIHNERQAALEGVLEEIKGEKVVVFCEFKEDVCRIKDACIEMDLAYGEVTGDQKDTVGGKIPDGVDVLICNTKSGGLGLNLVAARYAIFYSVGFALSDHLQARRRVHRGGQTRTVTYVHLVAKGTVDEHVYKALRSKKEIIDEILDAIKGGHNGT